MADWVVKVEVSAPGRRRLEAEFQHSPITIGAHADNDIVLNAPRVSGEHATVVVSAGKLVFEDRSQNGSFIEGKPITRHPLRPGEVVEIPPYQLTLVLTRLNSKRKTLVTPAMRTTADEAVNLKPDARLPDPAGPEIDLDLVSQIGETLPETAGVSAKPAIRLTGPAPKARSYGVCFVVKEPAVFAGRSLPLRAGTSRIGRLPDLEICLNWPVVSSCVSRLHASVTQEANGRYRIRDEGSKNGVFINGRKVKDSILRLGDSVALGNKVVLLFTDQAGEADAERT